MRGACVADLQTISTVLRCLKKQTTVVEKQTILVVIMCLTYMCMCSVYYFDGTALQRCAIAQRPGQAIE